MITAVFLLFFLSDLCCVISDALHNFFISNGLQPVCSFLARLFPVRTVIVPLLMIFGIKKGCNLVSVRYYIATGRTLFIYQTQARLIAVSLKTIRRLQKSSLALRHRLTTVLPTSFQLLQRKIYKRFMPLLPFVLLLYTPQTPLSSLFYNFFANCGFHASYSRIIYCPRIRKSP